MGHMESAASQHRTAIEKPAIGLLLALATVSFVAHMLVAGNYGYFRDELYYFEVLILVGSSPGDVQNSPAHYAHVTLAATERCALCVSFEKTVPITVVSGPTDAYLTKLWPFIKHYD